MLSLEYLLLESERLWLRPIEMKDADDIYQHFTQEITKYMFPNPNVNVLETEGFIRTCIIKRRKLKDLVMTIILKDTYEFIGLVGIHSLHTSSPELGIWIKKEAFHQGFGKEAIETMIDTFNDLKEVDYYVYPVDSRNAASKKLVQSLGGQFVHHEQKVVDSNKILEIDTYHIYQK